jgi:hypothetical protein
MHSSAPKHALTAAHALDATIAVDIKIEAISTELHGVSATRNGFPHDIGACCSPCSLRKFVRVGFADSKPGALLFAPGRG